MSRGAGQEGTPGVSNGGSRALLAQAGREALAELFPRWRIWTDGHGWHARRRGGFLQHYQSGAPTFAVHAATAVELAAQLRWQEAADEHAPVGCPQTGRPPA
jgi:hypothetical protein